MSVSGGEVSDEVGGPDVRRVLPGAGVIISGGVNDFVRFFLLALQLGVPVRFVDAPPHCFAFVVLRVW